jgi:hypothetical protein
MKSMMVTWMKARMVTWNPVCGDGILDEGEECVGGIMLNRLACNSSCTIEQMEATTEEDLNIVPNVTPDVCAGSAQPTPTAQTYGCRLCEASFGKTLGRTNNRPSRQLKSGIGQVRAKSTFH